MSDRPVATRKTTAGFDVPYPVWQTDIERDDGALLSVVVLVDEAGVMHPRALTIVYQADATIHDLTTALERQAFGRAVGDGAERAAREIDESRLLVATGHVDERLGAEYRLSDNADEIIARALDPDAFAGLRADAARSARRKPGRPPVTDEQKRAILRAYEHPPAGTTPIESALAVSGIGERQTREHIRAARRLRDERRSS